jgi:ribosomal protein S18 acetylase RimI-like enzyme
MYTFSLINKENIHSIIPLLKILDKNTSEAVLSSRLNEMLLQGYECVGIYEKNKLIGTSGIWIKTKYYIGKHIEPDNVIILPEYRNKGIGESLMKWIYDYGQQQGCVGSELNCYVSNDKGIKFWFNQDFKIIGFRFQKLFNGM